MRFVLVHGPHIYQRICSGTKVYDADTGVTGADNYRNFVRTQELLRLAHTVVYGQQPYQNNLGAII